MEDQVLTSQGDLFLGFLEKQDLSELSANDLEKRIEAMEHEIARCKTLIKERGATMAAAENLFKS